MSAPVPGKQSPSAAVVYSSMGLIALIWGSTWLVIKQGLESMPPLFGAGARFMLAGFVMLLIAPWLAKREGGERPPLRAILAHSLCQFVLNFALVYWSETVLPSGLVSVLWSVYPLFMAMTGHFLTKTERLTPRQWLGVLVALVGIVALFATDIANISPGAVTAGLLLLLGPLSVTFSTTVIKRSASNASSALLNRDAMLLGGVLLLGLSFVFERGKPMSFPPRAVLSVVYLAVAGSVVTFGLYLWLLRTVAAYRLALISYVIPAIAIWLGASFGNEPVQSSTLLGTALVIAGVALTLREALEPASQKWLAERPKRDDLTAPANWTKNGRMVCKSCGEEVDELVSVLVDGKTKKLCESCADEARESDAIAEESEAVVQNMMGFKGRR